MWVRGFEWGYIMKDLHAVKRFKDKTYSAKCINIMARFVQVARHDEGEDIHLQDKDLLNHIDQICTSTENQQLVLLRQRLFEELSQDFPDTEQDGDEIHDHWTISSKLKEWGITH